METDIAVGSGINVVVERDVLASRLALVSRAASARGAVQVLGGILLRARDGLLELEATDMELSLRTTVPATVEGEGAVVMPAKLLGDVVRLLPAKEATIAHRPEDGVASIESGSYSGRVNVFAAEDFPRLPSVDVPLHEIESASLLDTVQRVSRAASRDESRPVLTGILVRFEGSRLTMAATDSYRMAVKETELTSARPGARGDHPRPGARGARARRGGRRERPARREREPRGLRRRRRVADDAAHRRPVPERHAAPAGDLRRRARPEPRRAARGGAPRRGDGAAQHAAPAALRRGRADDLGTEPGRRRDAGVARGRATPASRSRSASTRSSCGRASSR